MNSVVKNVKMYACNTATNNSRNEIIKSNPPSGIPIATCFSSGPAEAISIRAGTGTRSRSVSVFDSTGTRLGMLGLPEKPTNLNWGGPGWSDLYITARTSVYRVRLDVKGISY